MSVTSTGARRSDCAAVSPPNPPPIMTTRWGWGLAAEDWASTIGVLKMIGELFKLETSSRYKGLRTQYRVHCTAPAVPGTHSPQPPAPSPNYSLLRQWLILRLRCERQHK